VAVRERDRGTARGPGAEAPRRGAGRERAGHAYAVVDGTLIAIGRVARDKLFYSGKHKKHGMNLQVIASPRPSTYCKSARQTQVEKGSFSAGQMTGFI
jgi:hypothetical protein